MSHSHAAHPPAGRANPLAIAALVVGILSILALIFFPLALVLGIAAIILGVLGRKRVRTGARQGGLALAGIILGAISTLLAILAIAGLVALFSDDDTQREFERELERQEQQQQ